MRIFVFLRIMYFVFVAKCYEFFLNIVSQEQNLIGWIIAIDKYAVTKF